MRRRLCRGLPGRADLAPDGRACRRRGHHGGARRPLRGERQRGRRRRDARRFGPLSDPRRRHLEGDGRHQCRLRRARQSLLGRRARRRADHRRRGLRRRLLDHAGAQPRLRDEVADLAPRSAAEPAVDRQGGRGRLRAVGGVEHAGDARDPHPRLPRPRPLHRQGQQAAALHRHRRAGQRRCATPTGSCCRPPPSLHEQEKINVRLPGGDPLRQGAQAQRGVRARGREGRHRPAGRHV